MGMQGATLENCLDLLELKKVLGRIGFVHVPRGYNSNAPCGDVLVVRKARSPVYFSAEVYGDLTEARSGKAYAQVFMNYRAPSGLARVRDLEPQRDSLIAGVPGVHFDRSLDRKSTRTGKRYVLGYQLGVVVKKHAGPEMCTAVCRALEYVSSSVEKQAKAVARR